MHQAGTGVPDHVLGVRTGESELHTAHPELVWGGAMNGPHDMGGMHGFGHVEPEPNEPVFHGDWEKTVYAISRVGGARGVFTGDEFRYAIERLPPAQYLASSYYERWIAALERLFVEKGVVSAEELEARAALLRERPDTPLPRREDPELVARLLARMRTRPRFERPGPHPRFAVGEAVRARNIHPVGHTRLPRYARGKPGVIHQQRGCHILPDASAHGRPDVAEPLYSVRFEGVVLWDDAPGRPDAVYLDLWESYLEPA